MRIQLFEQGTLFITQNKQYRLEIPADKVLAERPKELQDLQAESSYFFALKDIKRVNDRFVLDYVIENDYKPLTDSKKYSSVLCLSLLNEILELDPLHHLKEKVLVHPRNIFFRDMRSFKFLYRSNQWLPYEEHLEKLEQYKLLILSMISRFSYEKYKREKENLLKKENDEFFFHIEKAVTVKELKELISKRLQKEETQHFFQIEAEKNKVKTQKRIITSVSMGICAFSIGGSLFLQHSGMNKAQNAYAKKLQAAKQESKFYQLLSEKKYEGALSILKENGGSKAEMASVYFQKGQYQQAIDMDKHYIKPSVEALYAANKQDQILTLQADNAYLDIEKKIIRYKYSELLSMQSFINDKDQLFRMGKAFIDHGDVEDAKSVNEKLNNHELAEAIKKKVVRTQVNTDKKEADKP